MGSRRPATRAVVSAAWRVELDRHPGAFAQVAAHPATVAALTRTYRDLRELDGDQLELLAAQSMPAPDLVRLHRAVRASLRSWYDETDVLDAAATATLPSEPVLLSSRDDSHPRNRGSSTLSRAGASSPSPTLDTASERRKSCTPPMQTRRFRVVVRRVMAALGQGGRVGVLLRRPRAYSHVCSPITSTPPESGPMVLALAPSPSVRSCAASCHLLDLATTDLPRGDLSGPCRAHQGISTASASPSHGGGGSPARQESSVVTTGTSGC